MDNNISFNGAFLIKKPTQQIKEDILGVLGKRRQIMHNFNSYGDSFYVVRDSKDKGIANFIIKNNLDFKYYPGLNTKSGFDAQLYNEAKEIIKKSDSKVITSQVQLKKFFEKSLIRKAKKEDNGQALIQKTLQAINLNSNEYQLSTEKGYTIVRNKEGQSAALISPPAKFGITYAYVFPKNTSDEPLRCAIDYEGNIIYKFTGISEALRFKKNFMGAVKMHLNKLKVQEEIQK